jgi:hypothetical protein
MNKKWYLIVDVLLDAAVIAPVSTAVTNSGGRLQYDRSFLLSLASAPDSIRKPVDLPMLPDVILDLVCLSQCIEIVLGLFVLWL